MVLKNGGVLMTDKENTEKIPNIKSKNTKKKRHINAKLLWFFLLISSTFFLGVLFLKVSMIPTRWKLYCGIAVLLILFVTFCFSVSKKYKKTVIRIVNAFLSIVLIVLSCFGIYLKSSISTVINTNNGDKKPKMVKVNLYIINNEYKKNHADIFGEVVEDIPVETENSDNIEKLKNVKDSTFITTIATDQIYQTKAISKIEELTDSPTINNIDRNSVQEAVNALYLNEGQILVLRDSYVDTIKTIPGFESFDQDTEILYTIELNEETATIQGDTTLTTQPFSIFFGGNDTEGELTLVGRTDVDMVVSVNPNTHQIVITSFPRDSFVPNPAYGYAGDKLTHLGMSGLDNTLSGLGSILGIEINNYVIVNFTTFREITTAIGGVDIENPYGFEADDGEYFPEGIIHLEGDSALMYVRERHHLPDGDFGRNKHQQLVMKGIISKLTSAELIIHFNDLMNALKGTFLTNISDDAIYSLCQMQLDQNASWNVVNYAIEGDTGTSVCASMGNMGLSVVYPYKANVDQVASVIQNVYAGNIVSQEEYNDPTGQGYLLNGITPAEDSSDAEGGSEPSNPVETPSIDIEAPIETPNPEPVETPDVVETPSPEVPATPETSGSENEESNG